MERTLTLWLLILLGFMLACGGRDEGPTLENSPPEDDRIFSDSRCGTSRHDEYVCEDPDTYCHIDVADRCGWNDKTGDCRPRPTSCSAQDAPVCGCDGVTYRNECEAWKAGTSVEKVGACTTEASCERYQDCGFGEYCQYEEGACGDSIHDIYTTGTCQREAELCGAETDPVCGCDNQTYLNPCHARRAGVSIHHRGECLPSVFIGECNSEGSSVCNADEFCNPSGFQPTCPGDTGTNAYCQLKPTVCPTDGSPVCGCDGNTYDNLCQAHQAGVAVSAEGPCASSSGASESSLQ